MKKLQAPLTGLILLFTIITSCSKNLDQPFESEIIDSEEIGTISAATTTSTAISSKYVKVALFGGSNAYANAEWNNWNTSSSLASSTFKYSDGTASSVKATLSSQNAVSDNGSSYTTTMVAKEVGRYTSYSTSNRTLTISGLDNSKIYNLELYASRSGASNNTTRFTIGTSTVDIKTDNNLDQKAVFTATPVNGTITVDLAKLNTYNYLNGFILEESGSEDLTGSITANALAVSNSVKVSLFGGANAYTNAEWNNWNTSSSLASSTFKYSDGTASSVKATLSTQNAVSDNGSSYTTTMVAKEVGRYTSYSTSNRTLTITGLNNSITYTLELYASRSGASNNTTRFTVGTSTVDIKTDNNLDQKAVFTATPVNGTITVNLAKLNTYNYLNGFVLSENGSGGGSVGSVVTANAGADQTISLPVNSVQLTGSGSSTSGGAISYSWSRIAGPSQFTFSSTTIASPMVSNLAQGTYTFRLTVTDNLGVIKTDDVNVVVNGQTSGGLYANHTLTFDSQGNVYNPSASGLTWKPGDTVNIMAGTYGLIDLGTIKGEAGKPIIIRNKGGLVTVREIRFDRKMEHFKLLGNGHPGLTYGIKVANAPNIGIAAAMVSDMEIAYVEIATAGVGIMVKKNPVANDPSTQYPNYTIKDIKIHHNYIHDISTEGMYIGSTMPEGNSSGIPIRLQNVEIANNTLDRIGWDGIQMSTTTGTNSIHDNVVRDYGTVNYSSQQTGIAIGGAATGDIYNNTILRGTGWGINAMGYGRIRIMNNTLESVGANGIDKGAESIFADDRISGPESFPKQEMVITGNIIKYPQPDGAIRVGAYHNNNLPSTITNNTVYLPNAPTNWLNFYIVSNAIGSVISGNTVVR